MTTSEDSLPMVSHYLVSHCKPLGPIIRELKVPFKFGYLHLTMKEGTKVKSVQTRRFSGCDFLYVGLPSQTSRANNK